MARNRAALPCALLLFTLLLTLCQSSESIDNEPHSSVHRVRRSRHRTGNTRQQAGAAAGRGDAVGGTPHQRPRRQPADRVDRIAQQQSCIKAPAYEQPRRGQPAPALKLHSGQFVTVDGQKEVQLKGVNWFGFNNRMTALNGLVRLQHSAAVGLSSILRTHALARSLFAVRVCRRRFFCVSSGLDKHLQTAILRPFHGSCSCWDLMPCACHSCLKIWLHQQHQFRVRTLWKCDLQQHAAAQLMNSDRWN